MSKRKALEVFPAAPVPVAKALKRTQYCSICTENKPQSDCPSSTISHNQHENKACLDCWDKYIWQQIESGGLTQVRCFFCQKVIDIMDLPMLLAPGSMSKFQRALNVAAVKNASNYRECPSASCQFGYILISQGDSISHCRYCEQAYCNTCDTPMHDGQTCEAFQQERKGEDADILKVLAKSSKRCPNPKCGIHIQKISGCDHMTCRSCTHEFCYECGAPWADIRRNGLVGHRSSCSRHPGQRQSSPAARLWQSRRPSAIPATTNPRISRPYPYGLDDHPAIQADYYAQDPPPAYGARSLQIPPPHAYGARGRPPPIPADAPIWSLGPPGYNEYNEPPVRNPSDRASNGFPAPAGRARLRLNVPKPPRSPSRGRYKQTGIFRQEQERPQLVRDLAPSFAQASDDGGEEPSFPDSPTDEYGDLSSYYILQGSDDEEATVRRWNRRAEDPFR